MNKLPSKILPCPIIEATVELKFTSKLPKGAIFGLIYKALKDKFGTFEKLQTAMLPNDILENDPDLKYKPLYRLTDGRFTAQIGYDIVALHAPDDYIGWSDFSKNIIDFFDKIEESGVVDKSQSFVLRYLNFLEGDIYKNINLEIFMFKKPYESSNLVIKSEIPEGDYTKILQIANNVTVKNANWEKKGSLIDIACVLNNPQNFMSNIREIIEEAHKLEKELFFQLLNDKYLLTLKPEYKDE